MLRYFIDLIKHNIFLTSYLKPILTKQLTESKEPIKYIGRPTDISKDNVSKDDVSKYTINDTSKETTFIIKKDDREYIFHSESLELKCFYRNCSYGRGIICIYSINDTILIGFGIGSEGCNMIPQLNIPEFCKFIEKLDSLLLDNIKEIILFGHSYGMSSAIATAYILLRITNKIRAFNVNEDFDTAINSLKISDIFLQKIINIKIKVIGTGGTPTLFTKEKDFIIFYNALNHNYIHFVNYFLKYYDNFTDNLKCGENIYINYLMYMINSNYTDDDTTIYIEKCSFINMNNDNRYIKEHLKFIHSMEHYFPVLEILLKNK
jgi:hypothetical protein